MFIAVRINSEVNKRPSPTPTLHMGTGACFPRILLSVPSCQCLGHADLPQFPNPAATLPCLFLCQKGTRFSTFYASAPSGFPLSVSASSWGQTAPLHLQEPSASQTHITQSAMINIPSPPFTRLIVPCVTDGKAYLQRSSSVFLSLVLSPVPVF